MLFMGVGSFVRAEGIRQFLARQNPRFLLVIAQGQGVNAEAKTRVVGDRMVPIPHYTTNQSEYRGIGSEIRYPVT